jgi:hypothetical protein
MPRPAVVHLLRPGDVVEHAGERACHVAHLPHPIFSGLLLVIWMLERDGGSYSFDALNALQEVGELVTQTTQERARSLRRALRLGEAVDRGV